MNGQPAKNLRSLLTALASPAQDAKVGLAVFWTGVVAFGVFIAHHLLHDHRPRMPWVEDGIYNAFGRWTTIPLYWLSYSADIPVLNPLLGVLVLTVAGIYTIYCYGREGLGNLQIFLLTVIFVAFPGNLTSFYYTFATLVFTLAPLLAVLAAFACRRADWPGLLVGLILLLLMWTTYQASIGTFLVVLSGSCIGFLVQTQYGDGHAGRDAARQVIRVLLAGGAALVASLIIYAVSFKLIASGFSHASSLSLDSLIPAWKEATLAAFKHLWLTQPDMQRTVKVLSLIVLLAAFVGSLWVCRKSLGVFMLMLGLWIVCVLSTKAIFFMIEAKFSLYEYRVNGALAPLYVLGFWVLFRLSRGVKASHFVVVVLAIFIALRFVQADLVRQIVLKRGETHDLALANRLLTRIESLEELTPAKKYQLVRIGDYPWIRRNLLTSGGRGYDTAGDACMDLGFITAHWIPHEVFNYLGSRVALVHDDFPGKKRQKFAEKYLLQNRQPYPSADSVFLFDDTIFVYFYPSSEKAASAAETGSTSQIPASTSTLEETSEGTYRLSLPGSLSEERSLPCWLAVSGAQNTSGLRFNGHLTLKSDRDAQLKVILCGQGAPFEGVVKSVDLRAGVPQSIDLFHTFSGNFTGAKLQFDVVDAPDGTSFEVKNFRVAEYP